MLQGLRVLPAPFCRPQEETCAWLAAAHARSLATAAGAREVSAAAVERLERHIRRYSCPEEHINSRRSELRDFLHTDWAQMQILTLEEQAHGRGQLVRNQFFSAVANRRMEQFFEGEVEPPSDILHVTCTGYSSPSPAQRLIDIKSWHGRSRATQVYHMGCYAAIPALRVAAGLLDHPQDAVAPRVEIVHTELCSLHFNPGDHSPEQIVVQSLFADGHARYTLLPDGDSSRREGFEVLAVREESVPDSLNDMTWILGDHGFRMSLSRDVPARIAASLPPFLSRLEEVPRGNGDATPGRTVFAVHPGGPRIIDSIQELLGLEDCQLAHSRAVLREFGNMSSATLPHIWERIAYDGAVRHGARILSLAFGPGLTIAGALFEKC